MKHNPQIIPCFKLPEDELIHFAANQDQYVTLTAWRSSEPNGMVVTRWDFSWWDRIKILFGGSLWLSMLTFHKPLQPVKLETTCPLMGSAMLDEEI